ncbi:LD-carboxypeptidase [Alkalihalobacillus sp. LMS6]|uniref:S66 peptidase family protein n=1 Tax=Alkalihalobacillus sp. LMS6 TaxID=2924034 RepID=UPI0020D1A92B|nr:LD-carboxypeptidase [Alkalihalobacillus sp. LMS6]UTR05756.1 LD-carboxypeptidase [Alkalihalobacillus sp. LMS6]
MKTIYPKALQKGDTIGVIAPASKPLQANIEKAMKIYEEMGLQVLLSEHLTDGFGYLSAEDSHRIKALEDMFLNDEVKGIFCACGGYGTPRIVDQIRYDLIKENPKIFWGYSDITCLHTAIYQQTGLVTFHGPMMSSDLANEVDSLTMAGLKQIMSPTALTLEEQDQPVTSLQDGYVKGPLIGGNLTLLSSLIGSPYEINAKGALLFLEEIEEEPYRIDRMLNQLRLAGILDDAAGFVIGDFNQCTPKKRHRSLRLEDVFDHYLNRSGKPCIRGFPIGHCMPVYSIPYGAQATLDTHKKTVTIEAGTRE